MALPSVVFERTFERKEYTATRLGFSKKDFYWQDVIEYMASKGFSKFEGNNNPQSLDFVFRNINLDCVTISLVYKYNLFEINFNLSGEKERLCRPVDPKEVLNILKINISSDGDDV